MSCPSRFSPLDSDTWRGRRRRCVSRAAGKCHGTLAASARREHGIRAPAASWVAYPTLHRAQTQPQDCHERHGWECDGAFRAIRVGTNQVDCTRCTRRGLGGAGPGQAGTLSLDSPHPSHTTSLCPPPAPTPSALTPASIDTLEGEGEAATPGGEGERRHAARRCARPSATESARAAGRERPGLRLPTARERGRDAREGRQCTTSSDRFKPPRCRAAGTTRPRQAEDATRASRAWTERCALRAEYACLENVKRSRQRLAEARKGRWAFRPPGPSFPLHADDPVRRA